MTKRNVLKALVKNVRCFTPSGSSMCLRSRPSQASRYEGAPGARDWGHNLALSKFLGSAAYKLQTQWSALTSFISF